MEDVLEGLPVSVLLDDVGTAADSLRQCLRQAADVVLRLAAAGAMVGPAKCRFGITEGR
jgi:hypothetical protein